MKKIRADMDRYFEKMDKRWRELPVERQHQYTLYLFAGYLLLTAGVIGKVWYDVSQSHNDMSIEHIDNPILERGEIPAGEQDTVTTILKNQIYERK